MALLLPVLVLTMNATIEKKKKDLEDGRRKDSTRERR